MGSEVLNRKRAYKYMVEQAKKIAWIPPIDSDKRLAETLDIAIDKLNSLKEGLSNPTIKMITAFKNLVYPMVSEAEVDSYLVIPFKSQTKSHNKH